MSQSEAYNRRDLDVVAAGFRPDLEYYPYREFVETGLAEPCYDGPSGYRVYIQGTYEVWGADVRVEPKELIELGTGRHEVPSPTVATRESLATAALLATRQSGTARAAKKQNY